jgi:hypothetical protein
MAISFSLIFFYVGDTVRIRIVILFLFLLALTISLFCFQTNYFPFFFLGGLFVFMYGYVVLSPLLTGELPVMTWFAHIQFTPKSDLFVLLMLFLNIAGIVFGMLVNLGDNVKIKIIDYQNTANNSIMKLLLILSILSLPFIIKRQIHLLNNIKKLGYTSLYLGKAEDDLTLLENVFTTLYRVCCTLNILFISRKNKYSLLIIVLYLILGILTSLSGSRSDLFGVILFLVGCYCLLFNKKIKITLIFFFLILFPLLSAIMNLISGRSDEFKLVNLFIEGLGGTGAYLVLAFEKPFLFLNNHVPYIFAPIIGDNFGPQSEQSYTLIMASTNVSMGAKLSAILDRNLFVSGAGMGGNYILEMYDFLEMPGIFFLSMISIMIIIFFSKKYIVSNKYMKIILSIIFVRLPLIPRATYFSINIGYILRMLGLYILLFSFIKYALPIKHRTNRKGR